MRIIKKSAKRFRVKSRVALKEILSQRHEDTKLRKDYKHIKEVY